MSPLTAFCHGVFSAASLAVCVILLFPWYCTMAHNLYHPTFVGANPSVMASVSCLLNCDISVQRFNCGADFENSPVELLLRLPDALPQNQSTPNSWVVLPAPAQQCNIPTLSGHCAPEHHPRLVKFFPGSEWRIGGGHIRRFTLARVFRLSPHALHCRTVC
jgi:hypothetical protein